MLRQKIINSVQAGPFSSQNRIVDIDIAEGQVVNLAESFIVLTTRIANAPATVMNLTVGVPAEPHYTPFNVDYIRNCSLTGAKCGQLENIRRANVLNHNLLELSKSQTEKQSQVISLYQVRDNATTQLLSPYVQFSKEGDIPSTFRDVKLRIPLSHLFSLGTQTIDTSLTGTLRVHLELENGFSLSLIDEPMFQGVATEGVLENLVSGNVFVVEMGYSYLSESPYVVGMTYNFTYTDASDVPVVVDEVVTVTAVSFDFASGEISLTLTGDNLPLADQGDGKQYTALALTEITGLPTPTPTLQVALVELNVAEVVGAPPQKINELQYTTFTTEEFNTGNQSFLSKAFIIEPTCVNAMMMFVKSKGTILSNNIGVESYRLRCDESDIYDRDILVNQAIGNPTFAACLFDQSLHLDSTMRTFTNAALSFKNYAFVAMSRDSQTNSIRTSAENSKYGVPTNRLLVLSAPTPLTTGTKVLQVNVNCKEDQTIENVVLFKQVVRSVSFK